MCLKDGPDEKVFEEVAKLLKRKCGIFDFAGEGNLTQLVKIGRIYAISQGRKKQPRNT